MCLSLDEYKKSFLVSQFYWTPIVVWFDIGVCGISYQYISDRTWEKRRFSGFIFGVLCDKYLDNDFGRGNLL